MESCRASVKVAGDVCGCVIGGQRVAVLADAKFTVSDAVTEAATGRSQVVG